MKRVMVIGDGGSEKTITITTHCHYHFMKMINIGDWIKKWSFLQPHKRALNL